MPSASDSWDIVISEAGIAVQCTDISTDLNLRHEAGDHCYKTGDLDFLR